MEKLAKLAKANRYQRQDTACRHLGTACELKPVNQTAFVVGSNRATVTEFSLRYCR